MEEFSLQNLSLADVFSYIGDRKRCLVEGEAVLNANHIVCCGIKEKTSDCLLVRALCLQTSNLKAPPHEISAKITRKREITVVCSCKAGQSGFCKHGVGVLLYINKHSLEELEDLSSTDVRQEWGKLRSSSNLYLPTQVQNMCHVKKPLVVIPNTSDNTIRDIFKRCCPESALACHAKRRKLSKSNIPVAMPSSPDKEIIRNLFAHINSSKHFLPFEESIDFTYSELKPGNKLKIQKYQLRNVPSAQCMFYSSKVQLSLDAAMELCRKSQGEDCEDWFVARLFRITGSTCYEMFTYGNRDGACWQDKILRMLDPTFKGNKCTDYGKKTEAIAREEYCNLHKCKVLETGLIVNPAVPYVGFSPDGVVFSAEGVPVHLIEIKCPFKLRDSDESVPEMVKSKMIDYLYQERENIYLKKRHRYYAQCQLGLALLHLPYCDFIVYLKKHPIFTIRVNRDEAFIREMLLKLRQVYFLHFLPILTLVYC